MVDPRDDGKPARSGAGAKAPRSDGGPATSERVAKRPATYKDLRAVPEGQFAEILDGELVVMPAAGLPHSLAVTRIVVSVDPFSREPGGPGGPGGWTVLGAPQLHLRADWPSPDVVGWRLSRMRRLPATAHTRVVPDWICEVLSPGTVKKDRVVKARIYAKAGVGHYWIVDPKKRTLEVMKLAGGEWARVARYKGKEKVRVEPFEEMEIELGRWWGSS